MTVASYSLGVYRHTASQRRAQIHRTELTAHVFFAGNAYRGGHVRPLEIPCILRHCTQPPIEWVSVFFPGCKAAGA